MYRPLRQEKSDLKRSGPRNGEWACDTRVWRNVFDQIDVLRTMHIGAPTLLFDGFLETRLCILFISFRSFPSEGA